jgi:hypothetical protein
MATTTVVMPVKMPLNSSVLYLVINAQFLITIFYTTMLRFHYKNNKRDLGYFHLSFVPNITGINRISFEKFTYIPLTLYSRKGRYLRYSSETPTFYQKLVRYEEHCRRDRW